MTEYLLPGLEFVHVKMSKVRSVVNRLHERIDYLIEKCGLSTPSSPRKY